jgi:hypothetical protein
LGERAWVLVPLAKMDSRDHQVLSWPDGT